MSFTHQPVLLAEVLLAFHDRPLRRFVDCTLGLGGHASAILELHPEIAEFIGCDQDPAARAIATERLAPWQSKLRVIHANFSTLTATDISAVDGMLVDLGVSSLQLDHAARGFSFRHEGPLDMRMDPSLPLTAADIVNHWSESDLGRLIRDYGEEKDWRLITRAIIKARQQAPIVTTTQLAELIVPLFPFHRRRKTIHPATLTFQALRLAVNQELEVLKTLLPWAIDALAPGGRLAVISFHSLEDRIVKQAFQDAASDKVSTSGQGGIFLDKTPLVNIVTRKAIACSAEEADENPRARSAKLRVVEKR